MDTNKVVKSVASKVTETIVKEAFEWKQAIAEYQKKNEEQAKLLKKYEEKRIGFKF